MNLLGWMRAPQESLDQWDEFVALAAAVRADGLTRTLVCGMGGSSLVADVLAATFSAPDLHVLDSTNPAAVRAAGTIPTAVSAEKRPPTSVGCGMTARNPRARAMSSSGLPVSVMAMNCSGRARAAK